MKKRLIVSAILLFALKGYAQLYVPDGASGIGTSTVGGNVGIGTNAPQQKLHINGSLRGYDNVQGALQLYTDFGWLEMGPRSSSLCHFSTSLPKFYFNKALVIDGGEISSWAPHDLKLQTNYNTRLTILHSNGNVGIGITTPLDKMHIVTGSSGGTPYQNMGLTIEGTNRATLQLLSNNTSDQYVMFGKAAHSNRAWVGYNHNTNIMSFTHNATPGTFVFNNGNVGIGISTPLAHAKLNVHNGLIQVTGTSPNGGPMIAFGGNATNSTNGEWAIEYVSTGTTGLNFAKPWPSPNNGNNYLFIKDNGNIGINTNNPTARLTVNGNMLIGNPENVTIPNSNYNLFVETGILTEKIKVAVKSTSNWADYVFDEDHVLMPLNILEEYVKDRKHLPNIPSADEVVKEGIDLGSMDAKLLEKIEELTLYLIEQDKKIKELEYKINNNIDFK